MKHDYLEELKELASKPRTSYFDYVLWLSGVMYEVKEAIDGSQENPGETTPEQNLTAFLGEQNLFNPGTFNKNILIKPAENIFEELLTDLVTFANEQKLNVIDSVPEFSKNQITFLPNACQFLVEHTVMYKN